MDEFEQDMQAIRRELTPVRLSHYGQAGWEDYLLKRIPAMGCRLVLTEAYSFAASKREMPPEITEAYLHAADALQKLEAEVMIYFGGEV